MNRVVSWLVLLCFALPLATTSYLRPDLLNENQFLQQVSTVELINILSVITTVTLGVAAILFARIGELIAISEERCSQEKNEDRKKKYQRMISLLSDARESVKRTSFILIVLLGVIFVFLFVKSLVPGTFETVHALMSSFCIVVFMGNILSMIEIHQSIFRLPPVR